MDDILQDIQETEEYFSSLSNQTLLNKPLIIDNQLVRECLKRPKVGLNESNVDDVIIVWLRNETENKIELLNGINIKLFYTNDELINFISEIQTNNIFLIIDQELASNILSFLDDFSQIMFIYILTNDKVIDAILYTDSKRSIRQISKNITELFHSIKEDIDLYTKDNLSISIHDLQTEQQSKNLPFLWYHLLMNSLFDLTPCQQTAKEELVKYFREQYSIDDTEQQHMISEFEHEYSSANALRWYIYDSFVYHFLNKALRTRNIDLIFKFRFFIIDTQNQLEQHYNEDSIHSLPVVYSRQQLSPVLIERLKDSVGKYISINTYLSATIQENVSTVGVNDSLSILFIIHIESAIHRRRERIRPVYVRDKNYTDDDLESVFFPIGSIFLIDSIWMENNQWYMKLILADDHQYEQLFNLLQNTSVRKLPAIVQFADYLVERDEYDKAEQYLQKLIKDLETSTQNPLKGYVYSYMGDVSADKDDYNSALLWYKTALDFISTDNVYCAKIYIALGLLHYNNYEYDQALHYFEKALNYEHEMDFSSRIQLYLNFGRTYTFMNEFDEAMLYLNQALARCNSNPSNYHLYVSVYISLVILYDRKSDYNEALRLLQEVLDNYSNQVPNTDPYIIFIYILFGHLSYHCQDYKAAMIYCEKALELKESINPYSYIFLCTVLTELYKYHDDLTNQFYYAREAYHTYRNFISTKQDISSIKQIVYINMSICHYSLYDVTLALDFLFKIFEFLDDIVDKLIVLTNIATIYIDKRDIKMALIYLAKTRQFIADILEPSTTERTAIANLDYQYARVYHLENNFEKAILYGEKALQLNEENKNHRQLLTCCSWLSNLNPNKEHIYMKKLINAIEKYNLSDKYKQLYHTRIGLHFNKYKDFSHALHHFQCSVKYQLLNNPPCYYDLIVTYAHIGDIYSDIKSNNLDLNLFYYQKCVDLYIELTQDKQKMLVSEDNIKQSSFLSLKICIIYYFMGNLQKDKGNQTKALIYFRHGEQILNAYQEKNADILYSLIGNAYASLQCYNQAISCYQQSLSKISNDYNKSGYIYHLLADVYSKQKNYVMSISNYKLALTFLHNAHPKHYQYLASCYHDASAVYLAMNNYEYAFVYSKQSIQYHLLCLPINYDAIIELYKFSAIALWKWKPWDCKQSLEYLLPAIDFTQHNLKQQSLGNLYSTIGFFYILNDMYDKALLSYQKSLKYSTTIDDISHNYEQIWLINMLIGDLNQAYDIIKKSIDNQYKEKILNIEHTSKSYMNLGIIYYQLGKYELALKSYQTAFYFLKAFQNDQTHGRYGEIYYYIGLIHFKYGNLPDALKYCLKSRNILCLSKNRDFRPIDTYISLGLIECKLGNYSKSFDYFGQAWEVIYNNNHYHNLNSKILYNHIGYVYYKLNQNELAMKFYTKCLSLYDKYTEHPDLAQIYKNIGLIYEQNLRNHSIALSSYKHALELVPNDEHPDYILYKSMSVTIKLKTKRESKKIKKLNIKRNCQLI